MKKKTLPKWTDVYPQGCQEGDEEQEFFISLSRNLKWKWRSVAAIASEAKLTQKRVEEIIAKYYKKGMIFQNETNADQWCYWERNPDLVPDEISSITEEDHEERSA